MTRFPRRVIALVILLIIIGNFWYLSQRSNAKHLADLEEPYRPEPSENNRTPQFNSHKDGDNWNGDKESSQHTSGPLHSDENHAPSKGGSNSGSVSKEESTVSAGKKTASGSAASNERSKSAKEPAKSGASQKGGAVHKTETSKEYQDGMEVIKSTLDKIAEIHPGVGTLNKFNRNIQADTELENAKELPPTSYVMGMYLQVSDDELEALKDSHARMMKVLPKKLPKNAFGGRGIVMTGGGVYFPMVLTAIRWVRARDQETPIEVFMADKSEYEEHICDGLFRKINVECRVVTDIYGEALSAKLESKYALKPLAILASKFDDIYFMDADSYPLTDLNQFFEWSVYKETGLILNADYWPRYISPSYYKAVGVTLGGRVRGDANSDALLQSDREHAVPGKSTESGQIFVKKSQHIQSLLLAMYYNLYGPDVYFPLLMQGGHGEGDKDTYAAAAIICGESYYQTQRRPVTLGHHTPGGFRGYAMCQPNPILDYEQFEEKKDVEATFFALHANSIKSNPKYLLLSHDEPMRGAPPLQQERYFGDMNYVRSELGEYLDVEALLFDAMTGVACEWAVKENYIPRDWDDQDPERLCRILKKHSEWLKANPDVSFAPSAAYWIDIEK